jgi:hypothetical protein
LVFGCQFFGVSGWSLHPYKFFLNSKGGHMDLSIKNKVAVVSGSSKGIGYATAKVLLEEGCKVAISSRCG